MSEYQYYEFQAIDRPLGEADRAELQTLSSRARVTSTSFTNTCNFGDFRGDPRKLVERWFDLHLYLANWGTRRLMIRLPKRLLDPSRLEVFLHGVEWVEAWESGENLIVDMHFPDEESEYAGWEEGEGWLGALAPLRAELLAGDLRLFYLLWLTAGGSRGPERRREGAAAGHRSADRCARRVRRFLPCRSGPGAGIRRAACERGWRSSLRRCRSRGDRGHPGGREDGAASASRRWRPACGGGSPEQGARGRRTGGRRTPGTPPDRCGFARPRRGHPQGARDRGGRTAGSRAAPAGGAGGEGATGAARRSRGARCGKRLARGGDGDRKAQCRRLRAGGTSAPRPPGAGRGGRVCEGVLGTRSVASRAA